MDYHHDFCESFCLEKRHETLHRGGHVKHYLSVYKNFVATSAAVEMSFRTSFILLIFMDAFFFFTSLSSVNIIFNHVDMIGPWNRDQFSFFLCFMLMLDNLHMMMFSQSFWELSFNIRTGQLDYTILRPLNILFSVFFRHFRVSSLFNTPIFAGFLIYYGLKCDISTLSWLMLPICLVLALSLFIAIEFVLSACMFWTTDGNGINFLRMQFQQVARWPQHVYLGSMRKLFTIILPILVVGSYPVKFLLNPASSWSYLLILFALIIIFMTLAHYTWVFALRHYDSASS
jgi:ABC-2 type transport system permease protein